MTTKQTSNTCLGIHTHPLSNLKTQMRKAMIQFLNLKYWNNLPVYGYVIPYQYILAYTHVLKVIC